MTWRVSLWFLVWGSVQSAVERAAKEEGGVGGATEV